MSQEAPLDLLLGSYFGQGWRERYETWERAVDTFAGENELHLGATIEAAEAMLREHGDDASVTEGLRAAGSTYQAPPAGPEGRAWLELVVERLRSHAA